jgi:nicotinamidase-related amidase
MNLAVTPRTALVLIDVQQGIDEAAHWGGNRNNPQAEDNIRRLLEAWRAAQRPVVVVQHCSVEPASPFRPGHSGNPLKAFVQPLAGEKLVQKSATSAFVRTDLDAYLRGQGIDTLVITGFVTNNSVEATARTAGDTGFTTFVVADATACFDKTGIDGKKYDSQLVHTLSLSNLQGEYATIVTAAQLLGS